MNVLFFTRRVDKDDSRIGFAHRWIEELAKRVDKLYVVCLEKGETDLPENVEILQLGAGKFRRLLRFDKLMFSLARKVDVIFCHMAPIYTIISAPYAKLYRKKLYMWHTHGTVTRKLKMAHSLADGLLTASEGSVGIRSDKVIPLGHGIDTNVFRPKKTRHEGLVLITVGRLSPSKRLEILIRGMADLKKRRRDSKLLIVGEVPIESQKQYLTGLKGLVSELGLGENVEFVGPVEYSIIPRYYNNADVFVSASSTGSLDKAVLEAMACELSVVVSGKAYRELSGPVFFESDKDFTSAVEKAISQGNGKALRAEVIKGHELGKLMDKIVSIFEKG